jgi:hypothetical protein
LQRRFTLLPSKFFPAKIQKKNLAGKNLLGERVFYFAMEPGPLTKIKSYGSL